MRPAPSQRIESSPAPKALARSGGRGGFRGRRLRLRSTAACVSAMSMSQPIGFGSSASSMTPRASKRRAQSPLVRHHASRDARAPSSIPMRSRRGKFKSSNLVGLDPSTQRRRATTATAAPSRCACDACAANGVADEPLQRASSLRRAPVEDARRADLRRARDRRGRAHLGRRTPSVRVVASLAALVRSAPAGCSRGPLSLGLARSENINAAHASSARRWAPAPARGARTSGLLAGVRLPQARRALARAAERRRRRQARRRAPDGGGTRPAAAAALRLRRLVPAEERARVRTGSHRCRSTEAAVRARVRGQRGSGVEVIPAACPHFDFEFERRRPLDVRIERRRVGCKTSRIASSRPARCCSLLLGTTSPGARRAATTSVVRRIADRAMLEQAALCGGGTQRRGPSGASSSDGVEHRLARRAFLLEIERRDGGAHGQGTRVVGGRVASGELATGWVSSGLGERADEAAAPIADGHVGLACRGFSGSSPT